MRSELPKVLHVVGGRPMVLRVLDALYAVRPRPRPVAVVVGRKAALVRAAIEADRPEDGVRFALQRHRMGTGHALLQAAPVVAGAAPAVLVTYGDVPLLRAPTLQALLERHACRCATVTMLTTVVGDPTGYGRVVRAGGRPDGAVMAVIEQADASAQEQFIREINAGVYVFDDEWTWPALAAARPSPSGEIYLTDLIRSAIDEGRTVETWRVDDPTEVLGVNTPDELAAARVADDGRDGRTPGAGARRRPPGDGPRSRSRPVEESEI